MFISYAQNFEDVILNRLFKGKDTGFYIDIGAQHPICDSVTKAFYDRGWRGINIEPVKEFFDLLQEERPKDINLNIAISNHDSDLTFFELQGSGFSTLDEETAVNLAQEYGLNLLEYSVKTKPLDEVCKKYVDCPIDFLKIDVEGWEEQVIIGNDWDNFRPSIVIVKATLPAKPVRKTTNISDFLKKQGYEFIYFDGLNDFYIAKEAKRFCSYFEIPPNIFDNFISFKLVDAQNHAESRLEIVKARETENNNLKVENDNLKVENDNLKVENNNLKVENNKLNAVFKDQSFESQRLHQQLKQLQQVREEILHHYEKQTNELYLKLSEKDTKSHEYSTQLEQSNERILAISHEYSTQLEQANERILAMETSKFWKIRKSWFSIRKIFGIPGD